MGRGGGVCEPRRSCYAKSCLPGDRFKPLAPIPTMHGWEAKHYIIAAVIILVVMGMFVYSWS